MKSKCNLCRVVVAAIFMLATAVSAVAVPLNASFYLPKDTYWGGTLLPAGQYTLTMENANPGIPIGSHGAVVLTVSLQSDAKVKASRQIMVAYTESVPSNAASHLVLVKNGETRMVNVLYSAATQTAFWFNVPKGYSVTTRIIAQQSTTPVMEYVPVTFAGE